MGSGDVYKRQANAGKKNSVIITTSISGRGGDNPLLMYIRLREKLGAKEKDYE